MDNERDFATTDQTTTSRQRRPIWYSQMAQTEPAAANAARSG